MPTADAVVPVDLPSAKELARFAGLWVAVSGGKVIASGKTPTAVLREARAHGVDLPVIFHAPLSTPRAAFY